MATIQAIETVYRGHRFRSRLEARWAVFFDRLGIEWRYEPQGYEIVYGDETRRYLPDFYLPRFDVWVEVKGDDARIDWALLGVACDGFADAGLPESGIAYGGSGNGSAVLVLGNIPPDGEHWYHPLIVNAKGVYCKRAVFNASSDLVAVMDFGYFDATWNGFAGDWMWEDGECPSVHGESYGLGCAPWPAVRAAYTAARSARFERGEAGR
jgi:hypothetical protein